MFALLLLTIAVVAAASYDNFVQMEPDVSVFSAPNWLKESKVDISGHMIETIFVLKHDKNAVERFHNKLMDLSNPSSKNYGKWMKRDEIVSELSPAADNVKTVMDFLHDQGLDGENVRLSKMHDKIHVKMSVAKASEMLKTSFSLFRSVQRRDIALPRVTGPYYLPEEIAEHVSLVGDLIRFPAIRDSPRSYGYESNLGSDDEFSSCGTKCSGFTTPDVLKSAYNYDTVTKVAAGNSMSVAEFQFQYYDNTDLQSFSSACDVTADVEETIGGNIEQICEAGGCVEALLDIEYIEAVANPIPLTVIYSSTYSLLDWVDQVLEMDNPPLVHSVSYGNDEVQQTSAAYMEECNTQFMAAGAMGLSILFASGDQGVWGRSGVGKTFHPDFPAASPYVTAVGGTDFASKSTIGEESAWSCGGGGFSDTFAMPDWQTDAVTSYLTKAAAQGVLPDTSLFNSSGRAYPDVAALGGQVNPYCVAYSGGSFGGVSGTSASCPVVAGIFAQLNNDRLAAGMSSLGWLNPFIYSNPSCFNDVTDGSTNNCYRNSEGFAAISGWDAATGFGSPNYECLQKAATSA